VKPPAPQAAYAERRAYYRRLLTVYGRKAVLEALCDASLAPRTLHLARSNRAAAIVNELRELAERRDVAVREHSRAELSRISRNGRQDQGVALDVHCPRMQELEDFLAAGATARSALLALDGVSNPQNMGMALRSATAAGIDGILYADRGNPALGPLVIKASAGTVFRAPLLRCTDIAAAATHCMAAGYTLYRLDASAPVSLFDTTFAERALLVLGGESDGISPALRDLQGTDLSIPMASGVESLNVAVSAALVAYAAKAYFDR
jgi:23S rRNA (guanosine2251-2'-O)-methyltransferase